MQLNPYAPPKTITCSDGPVRPFSRDALATTIRAFLSSEISAFEFDELLDAFRDSKDTVIQHVVEAVWFHYDDCIDHRVCLSKTEWDYFQRLLLVLSADCRAESDTERRWSPKQLVAAISLCIFTYFAFPLGWGTHLLALSIPFGFVSIALSFWRGPAKPCETPYQPLIFPFATFSDLAKAYRSAKFRKTPYPKQLADRSIRSPLRSLFWQIYAYLMWLVFSPLPLMFQTLPETRVQARITVI